MQRKQQVPKEYKRVLVARYLDYIGSIGERIDSIQEDMDRIESMLTGKGVDYSGMPHGSSEPDRMALAVAKLEEKRDELVSSINMYAGDYMRMKDFCRTTVERRLCWLHYVDGLTWGRAARREGYSESRARSLCWYGIADIYELIPEEFRRSVFPKAQPWEEDRRL